MTTTDHPPDAKHVWDPERSEFPAPDLGRTVHVVGPVTNVDPQTLPHPMNQRGELGKALYNWRHNTIANDPLVRIAFDNHCADRNHVINTVMRRFPKGKVNPSRTEIKDPAIMSRHIKRVARHLGMDVVGIGRSHPSFIFAGKTVDPVHGAAAEDIEGPEELAKRLPYLVCGTLAWDYELTMAHRHHIGDAAYDFPGQRTALILMQLEAYIKELGYNAVRGAVNGQAAALASGIGELGRNGMIITEKFGSRIHASDAIMTDLTLEPDGPIDIGVEDFCKVCRKCAVTCPTNSITFEGKQTYNGVEKYKINWETCYKLRPYVVEHWGNCLTCVAVCPYTKPNTWWHALAVRSLRLTPLPLRSWTARGLKWLDDKFWGVVPRKRVRWLGYDTGVKPGEAACTIQGCTSPHGETGRKIDIPLEEIGYYYPLKENTNRFVKGRS